MALEVDCFVLNCFVLNLNLLHIAEGLPSVETADKFILEVSQECLNININLLYPME